MRSADDQAAPVAEITSPEADAEVTGRIQVKGSASDDHFAWYKLLWRPMGATDADWREIRSSSTPVSNGVLGSFDPTTLDNGLYQLALVAADTGGLQTTRMVTIEVYGEQKLGQFSISFIDLSIEAAVIPIQVTRTYDTRRKADKLDFGYGWSVDYQSVRPTSPPILSSTGIWSPIPQARRLDVKKRHSEEQIIGFLKEADAGGAEGSVPPARLLGSQLLSLAQQVRRHGSV